jgi:uncharacterized membrane protein
MKRSALSLAYRAAIVLTVAIAVLTVLTRTVFAQSPELIATPPSQPPSAPTITYFIGTITAIEEEQEIPIDGRPFYAQIIQVRLRESQEVVRIGVGSEYQPLTPQQRLRAQQTVVVGKQTSGDHIEYVLADVYRLPMLWILASVFVFGVILIAGKRGFMALAALGVSLLILMNWMLPEIVAGVNPVFISVGGCVACAVIAQYFSHGWSARSHLAMAAIVITLLGACGLAAAVIVLGHFVGLGSEEALFLQFASTRHFNLQWILLAGIILGTLGVLDDVVAGQISVIAQLKETKPDISFHELIVRGLQVGKDHVASLTNTLVLAYAGSSLPLFLLFHLDQSRQPLWVTLNSEMVAEELIRTLIGSIGIIAAVPITTCLAAYVYAQPRFGNTTLNKD